MKVAAYIRVSTEEQAEKGNSLIEQKERANAYCTAMGWDSPSFFIDDGYSAKNLKRPDMQNLIESVKQFKWDVVLTTKLDRLCRNLLDLLQLVDLFTDYKCNYVSASESFDTSNAVGRMTLQLLGTFAEFERERISERVKDNMMSLARNTDKAITLPCYGYDIADGKYLINEQEAVNVRYMFELAEQGNGHRMIAKLLNEKGVTTKRGKLWDQVNVKRLMKTETLTGKMIYNKRQSKKGKTTIRDKDDWVIKENHHPFIINPEQFEKVSNILQARSRAYKHAESDSYLLTGLVKCKYCGGNMKGSTSRHKTKYNDYIYHRYICSSYVSGYGCKYHAVHRGDLEKFVIDSIKSLVAESNKEVKVVVASSITTEDEIMEIESKLTNINKRMQKQIEAYENDLISPEDLKTARIRIDGERNKLELQLDKVKSRTTDEGSVKKVKKKAKELMDDILSENRIKAKQAIRMVIHEIFVQDAEIEIVYKNN